MQPGLEWQCDESNGTIVGNSRGEMICVTNPPSNQATEVEPEGFEVEERWMCEEGGLEAYASSDGRIICHEPE